MIYKLARSPGLYLVGFMGSGKTTVGRILADRLGWNFVDLDAEIEAEQNTTICQIFDKYGEEHFRELEAEAIRKRVRQVQMGRPAVIALGGGAFAQNHNASLVMNNGVTIWLDCPLDLARERVSQDSGRPLARDPQAFEQLYLSRRDSYARADYRIEISGSDPETIVEAILSLPIF